jgi:dTDP-4-amino-4,6-dideoxygalactose transaminase
VSHQLLRLPLYCGLTEAEQTEVIDTLLSFSTD